ncbi:hypothetical protein, partial [Mesobacillus zeae]|uniref:hypothetical protein n=1 Tax=Mesobacillus zeae TaxID=1917180 RepID=UPI0030087A4E
HPISWFNSDQFEMTVEASRFLFGLIGVYLILIGQKESMLDNEDRTLICILLLLFAPLMTEKHT